MSGENIYSMPGVLTVEYRDDRKTALAHYDKLSVPSIREAIEKGLAAAAKAGAKTWVIDLTRNPGVPRQDDAKWIETEAVRLVIANGFKAVINVHGGSAVARMGSQRWSRGAQVSGLSIYDTDSIDAALELGGKVATGQAS